MSDPRGVDEGGPGQAAPPGAPPDRDPALPGGPVPPAPGGHAPGEPLPAPRRHVREHVEIVLVAVLVVLFTSTFVAQNSVIPTASMEDTLLVGDYVLVNRVAFAAADAPDPAAWTSQRPLRRGDVVVFKFPRDPATDYVKRVVGLPGETLEIRDKDVWVDGARLDEPYKVHKTGIVHERGTADGARDNFGPVTVPAGHYFVMGDNRDYSADSREWSFVPRENVTGRAFAVFWSRRQAPGAWQVSGASRLRRFVLGLSRFYRETRWDRIGSIVR